PLAERGNVLRPVLPPAAEPVRQDEHVPAPVMPGGVVQVVQPRTGRRQVVLVPGPVQAPPGRPRRPAVVASQRDNPPRHGIAAHQHPSPSGTPAALAGPGQRETPAVLGTGSGRDGMSRRRSGRQPKVYLPGGNLRSAAPWYQEATGTGNERGARGSTQVRVP